MPGAELEKLSPSLKWVIALPIKSAALGSVLGVISVDGLDKVPDALHDSSKDDYKAAVLALFATTLPRFGPSLDNAFRGDQLPQLGS